MKLLVYEYLTGGGSYQLPSVLRALGDPFAGDRLPSTWLADGMLAEGWAMATALVDDLLAAGLEVTQVVDSRLVAPAADRFARKGNALRIWPIRDGEQLAAAFQRAARDGYVVIVIAPETDGTLLNEVRRLREIGAHVLAGDLETLARFSDKTATCDWLAERGLPVPNGVHYRGWVPPPEELLDRLEFPVVAKPNQGAGSDATYRWSQRWAIRQPDWTQSPDWRIESWCAGRPASVSFLCGPQETIILQPCWQHFDAASKLCYLGGAVMEEGAMADRIVRLARRLAPFLESMVGFVGADLMLGPEVDGGNDVFLELNPRCTTSYIGLRHATDCNLAERMVRTATGMGGRQARERAEGQNSLTIPFPRVPIRFTCNGVMNCDDDRRLKPDPCNGSRK